MTWDFTSDHSALKSHAVARAGTKTGDQEAEEPQAGPTRSEPAPTRKQENRKYFTEVPHASCSQVPDLTTRAGGRRASKMRGSSPEEVL